MKTNAATMLKLCNIIITHLERKFGKPALLSNNQFRDLYLDARKLRYNLINAPEAFR